MRKWVQLSNLSQVIKLGFESIDIGFYCPVLPPACQTTNKISALIRQLIRCQLCQYKHRVKLGHCLKRFIQKCCQVCHECYANPEGIMLPIPIIYNLPVTSTLLPQLIFFVWLMVYTKLRSLKKKTIPNTK